MKQSPKRRKFQIRNRKRRKAKLRKLKTKYLESKNNIEKEKIVLKINKVSPLIKVEEYLNSKK